MPNLYLDCKCVYESDCGEEYYYTYNKKDYCKECLERQISKDLESGQFSMKSLIKFVFDNPQHGVASSFESSNYDSLGEFISDNFKDEFIEHLTVIGEIEDTLYEPVPYRDEHQEKIDSLNG